MRLTALIVAAGLAAATPAFAEPASITIALGPDLQDKVDELGQREVDQQITRLTEVLNRTLDRRGALEGARIDLVLTELKPNRPTMQQAFDRPGLDIFDSISIGGAAFEGQVELADGRVEPIRYDWFTTSLWDVRGYATWQDADRAYGRLADNLAEGRFYRR